MLNLLVIIVSVLALPTAVILSSTPSDTHPLPQDFGYQPVHEHELHDHYPQQADHAGHGWLANHAQAGTVVEPTNNWDTSQVNLTITLSDCQSHSSPATGLRLPAGS